MKFCELGTLNISNRGKEAWGLAALLFHQDQNRCKCQSQGFLTAYWENSFKDD